MYPHQTIHKQFFLRWLILLCGVVILIWGWTVAVSSQDYDDPCADFEMAFVDVDTLPGTIVFRYPASTDIYLMDGATFQVTTNQSWNNHLYLTMSADRRWLFTWQPYPFSSDEQHRIWMYDLLEEHDPTLLVTSPPYSTYGAGWIDAETLRLNWRGAEHSDDGSMLIRPFDDPIHYLPLQHQIGEGEILYYSPDGRRVLVWVDTRNTENSYYIHNLATGEVESLPGRELPAVMQFGPVPSWSNDGRLAYAAPIVHLETYDRLSEEWFIHDFDNDTNDQISNLLDEFGGVEILTDMAWSPDGQYIAFTMTAFAIPQPYQALYIMDSYTGEVTPVCVLPDYSANSFQSFFWSADSEYIAFVYEEDLMVFHLETRTFSRIMENVSSLLDWR